MKIHTAILIVFSAAITFCLTACHGPDENKSEEAPVKSETASEFQPDKADDLIYFLEGDEITEVVKVGARKKKPDEKVLPPARNKKERILRGKAVYQKICIACHQPNGLGIPATFPPLASSDFLNENKERAINIVVNGLVGEIVVNGDRFHNLMPNPKLNDEDVANVLTFVYSKWGNSGKEVTPTEVKAIRKDWLKVE